MTQEAFTFVDITDGDNWGKERKKKWEALKPTKLISIKEPIIHVSAGLDMAFALTASRNVFAWGSGKHGKLGVGDCRDAFVPRLVIELSTRGDSGVVKIVAGAHHAHALTAGGSLYSWGLNSCGQLGLGSDIQSKNIPTIVKEFRYWNGTIRDVFTSSKFSLAIVNIPKKIESKTLRKVLKIFHSPRSL